MTSVIGLGSLVGAIWLSRQANPEALATMALSNGLLMGAALLAGALAGQEWLGLLALFVLGFGMVVSGIANQTVIQLAVPDHLRGRLLALHSMIFRGAPALGALVIGRFPIGQGCEDHWLRERPRRSPSAGSSMPGARGS
jgi:predicted MFS family arabinose efflux permease